MIGYLLRHRSQVPGDDRWLTAAELCWLDERRSAKRIADWRLGRWTAKAAVLAYCELGRRSRPQELEILAAADGAPGAFAGGRPLPLTVSLSHSHGWGLCTVGAAGVALGCDLERIEPRGRALAADFFTRGERIALAAADAAGRDLLVNLIWSAKESALKALRHGLRADTRSVEVTVHSRPGLGWGRLEVVHGSDGTVLAGRWRLLRDLLATVVCHPAARQLKDLDDR